MTSLAPAPPFPARNRSRFRIAPPAEEKALTELDDTRLLTTLREGDEAAFTQLVARYHGSLKRVARTFGAVDAVAEEIVQETWLAALQGLDRFEGRSSLKTWLFGILKNQARQRAAREHRMVPFSSLAGGDEGDGPVVDALRFQGENGCWPDHWALPPRPWEDAERRLASLEARRLLRAAIADLPPRQRAVVALRDVEGLSSDEVCDLLELSEGNQRVLLHRARATMRNVLEGYLDE